jgi:hypothetical protein
MQYLKPFLAGITIALSAVLSTAHAANITLTPSSNSIYVASNGEVILTFVSKSALYSNDLFLSGRPNVILNNQTAAPGSTYSLGNFQQGAELSFEMFVNNTGYRFFSGDANRNPDNTKHVAFSQHLGQPLVVGFEDIFKGGDFDYNDLVFSLTNVTLNVPVTPVPEPQTFGMLALGLGLLGFQARRRSAK